MALVLKNVPTNAGETGSILGSGRSPGEGNGNPLQYSCLENPVDRGAWWATVHGVAESQTQLSNYAHTTDGRMMASCQALLRGCWNGCDSFWELLVLKPRGFKPSFVDTFPDTILTSELRRPGFKSHSISCKHEVSANLNFLSLSFLTYERGKTTPILKDYCQN